MSIIGDLEGLLNSEPWVDGALCGQVDPELFHPLKGGSTVEAKRICGMCEVRQDCLDYALKHRERSGIWGGLSERQRRDLLRRMSA